MTTKEDQVVFKRYDDCKVLRQEYTPLWRDVENYVAPAQRIKDEFEEESSRSDQKDIYINDPTAYISATQAADYVMGIIWGNGREVYDLIPSRHVLNLLSDENQLDDYYQWATQTLLSEQNHDEAGLIPALKSHTLDQSTFGTSGVGSFVNKDYRDNKAENALQYKRYGVYNSCVDEGANGKIKIVFNVQNWRTTRVVDEFAVVDGELDKELFAKLPGDVQQAYKGEEYNRRFKIVHAVLPNGEFALGKAGKKGAKFKGFFFYENEKVVFKEEFYNEMPIHIARAVKISDQVYGSSAGILSISSIKMLNYVTGNTIEAIEKLVEPARGMMSGALVNGNLLDLTSKSVTQFNPKSMDKNPPLFNISDVGDITGNVQVLIPKAEKDITTIFKIDQLLDFNSAVKMTATESIQRFSIRAKSLSGLIQQQVNELLRPMVKRDASILWDLNLLGSRPDTEEAEDLTALNRTNQIIPEEVLEVQAKGLPWFDIKFNNELDQINNAQQFEDYSNWLLLKQQLLQTDPTLLLALNQFEELQFAKAITNLDNKKFVLSKTEYEDNKKKQEELSQQSVMLEAENTASDTVKNLAGAEKDARAQG